MTIYLIKLCVLYLLWHALKDFNDLNNVCSVFTDELVNTSNDDTYQRLSDVWVGRTIFRIIEDEFKILK